MSTVKESEDLRPITKHLCLGMMSSKLESIAYSTGRSQSEIVRGLLKVEMDKIPEMFRPKLSDITCAPKHKKAAHFYLGEKRPVLLENFKKRTKMEKSTFICFLIDQFIHDNPHEFEPVE